MSPSGRNTTLRRDPSWSVSCCSVSGGRNCSEEALKYSSTKTLFELGLPNLEQFGLEPQIVVLGGEEV
jgi:hypothetical protein